MCCNKSTATNSKSEGNLMEMFTHYNCNRKAPKHHYAEDLEQENMTTFQAMKMARQKVENERTGSNSKQLKEIMVKRRMSLRDNKNTIGFSSAAREAYSQLKTNRGYRDGNNTSPFR